MDYGRLVEFRSILLNVNMLVLIVIVLLSIRILIMKKFCMEKVNVVVGNCDRKNIIFNCVKVFYDENFVFFWLIESLMI